MKSIKKLTIVICAAAILAACSYSVPIISAAEPPEFSAPSVVLADAGTGTVLFEQNSKEHRPIASMVKIMTLLIVFDNAENGNLAFDEKITVSENAASMGGSQAFLDAHAEYLADELIKSIVVASANDSCVAMAERISGSEKLFVKKMNERAKALGMNDTAFVNCTGLPAAGQYSCAHDVAVMLSELLRHGDYFYYSRIWMDTITHKDGRVTEMANTNKLIRSYQGCDAGKTGYTSEAGFCLAASAERGNLRAVAVVIGATDSKTRFDNTRTMFDYVFANYTSKAVLEENVLDGALCKVVGGKKKEIAVRPARPAYVFCSKDDTDAIDCVTQLEELKAPVAAGDAAGAVVVYKNGVEYDRIPLIANEDSARCSYLDSLRDVAENWGF